MTRLSELSRELRLHRSPHLCRLPDLPVRPFDSNRVNASEYAYKRLQVPDAFLMGGTYAVTAALAMPETRRG
jgi:hypothetical protein